MDALKERVLNQAIKMLDNLGVKYKIIDTDDVVHKNYEDEPAKKERKYPYGELRKYVRTFLDNGFEAGTMIEINCGHFDPYDVQSSLCAYSSKNFGQGSVTTQMNRSNNTVTAYRAY